MDGGRSSGESSRITRNSERGIEGDGMNMKTTNCVCGHEKRDHCAGLGLIRYGACKVCLCDAYAKPAPIAAPEPALVRDESLAGAGRNAPLSVRQSS
jgi:hypothetical protein